MYTLLLPCERFHVNITGMKSHYHWRVRFCFPNNYLRHSLTITIYPNQLFTAICSALNVGVRVEYMDRGEAEGGQVTAHEFPDGLKPKVYLLYRPGHYDILYPN